MPNDEPDGLEANLEASLRSEFSLRSIERALRSGTLKRFELHARDGEIALIYELSGQSVKRQTVLGDLPEAVGSALSSLYPGRTRKF